MRLAVNAIVVAVVMLFCAACGWEAEAAEGKTDGGGRVKSGTAFYVTAHGDLVTSAHVVRGCPSISVFGRDGVQRSARLVAVDRRLDVALMRTVDLKSKHIGTRDPENFPIGQEVHAIGYGVIASDPRRPTLSRGKYVGFGTTPTGVLVRVVRLHLREGESGGPIINGNGELLGMAIGRYTERPELGVLVPTRDIGTFLEGHGVKPSRNSAALSPDPHDALLSVSVLVQCLGPAARDVQAGD